MKNLKRFFLLCVLCLSMAVLCSCQADMEPADAESLKETAVNYMAQIIGFDDQTIDALIDQFVAEQDVVMQNGLNSWKDSKEELGSIRSLKDIQVAELNNGEARVTIQSEFENRDCEFAISFDKRRTGVTELTFNPVYSLSEKLSQALVNLAVGMGTVFAVLIFLTWIISLFKYVNRIQNGKKEKQVSIQEAGTIPVSTEENSADDNEIQAVIAAAIAAYESEAGDLKESFEKKPVLENGTRIRSYRR